MLRGLKQKLLVCLAIGCFVGDIDCRLERSAQNPSTFYKHQSLRNGFARRESVLRSSLRSTKQTGVPAPGQRADLVTFQMTLQITEERFLELEGKYSDEMADFFGLDPTQIEFAVNPEDGANSVEKLNVAVSIVCAYDTGKVVEFEINRGTGSVNARLQDVDLPTANLSRAQVETIEMPKESTSPPIEEESDDNEEDDTEDGGNGNRSILIALVSICGASVLLGLYIIFLKLRERKRQAQILENRMSSHTQEVQQMIAMTSSDASPESTVVKEIITDPTNQENHIITVSCPVTSQILPVAGPNHLQPRCVNPAMGSATPSAEPSHSQDSEQGTTLHSESSEPGFAARKESSEGLLAQNPGADSPSSRSNIVNGASLESRMYYDDSQFSSMKSLNLNPEQSGSHSGCSSVK